MKYLIKHKREFTIADMFKVGMRYAFFCDVSAPGNTSTTVNVDPFCYWHLGIRK